MSYLSYSSNRNIAWTYHKNWPKRAIKNEIETAARWSDQEYLKTALQIFKFNEDETVITLIPRNEWEAEAN